MRVQFISTLPENKLEWLEVAKHLGDRVTESPDVVLHHCWPHEVDIVPGAVNIGLAEFHTTNPRVEGFEKLDGVLVSTVTEARAARAAGLSNVETCHLPIFPVSEDLGRPEFFAGLDDRFIFLYRGPCDERSNLRALINAYTTTFLPSEPVLLVLALEAESENQALQWVTKHSHGLISAGYESRRPNLAVEWRPLVNSDAWYAAADAFVFPVFGSPFSRAVAVSRSMGKPCLVTAGIGASDVPGVAGVTSRIEPCAVSRQPHGAYWSGFDRWWSIDSLALAARMRQLVDQPVERAPCSLERHRPEAVADWLGSWIPRLSRMDPGRKSRSCC